MKQVKKEQLAGWDLYKWIFKFAQGYFLILVVGIACNAFYSSADALMTYLIKPIVNKGFIARDAGFLIWLPVIIVGVILGRAIFNFFGSYLMALVSRSIVMNMRRKIFRHFLNIPAVFYDNRSVGDLLSLMLFNVDQVSRITAEAITRVFQSIFLIISLLVVMFTLSWKLTIVFFFVAPLMAVVIRISNKFMRRYNYILQQGMGKLTGISEESISGYREVRTFAGETYEKNRFDEVVFNNRRREVKIAILQVINTSGVQLLGGIALALVIYLATANTATMISTGSFVAMIAAMFAMLKPLKQLTNVNNIFQAGYAGANSVYEFLEEDVEHDSGDKQLDRVKGKLEFNIKHYAYPNTDKGVLHDIRFVIEPGQTCALVGRSGSGKSTLVSLIPRFYELAEHSDILIDENSIKDCQLLSLRQQIAIVSQRVTLFNDTIYNNVAYGALRDKPEKDVIAALKAAHAWEFVEPLEKGVNTLIGDNGLLLSGGQRQRLAIARAILKDAPILILDEATASLDNESERLIQDAMVGLMQDRTSIVIAHRLSTIEKSDNIIVMDAGRIAETGNHKFLLEKNGYYRKLYDMQFQT